MHLTCRFCGLSNLRTSRLRLGDLPRLVLLHYPVRCRECKMRSYVTVFSVLGLRHSRRRHA